ncbi:probable (S)-N-methylcoclaurine 3'-hydroxylase isozyme 2 [Lactuca sativa]|uniref:Cytochrome P450 n=1 Tax=Lactuca sativa TaxID=4236 RepID=A0A9R1VAC2_LACSA|nr:probable (S)-N-methylcoclaurine 3'-hydroxylase isozyme 2 [Lactuca sativa]KAJ0201101.1 hypothetical protein LSAT_V11C600332700 [Lactuca sativa]
MLPELGYKIYLRMNTLLLWWWEVDSELDKLARTLLTISVPTLLLLWYKWTVSYSRKRMPPFPPGPYGLPVVGYLPFLGSNLHEIFTEMADRYGPIFSLQLGRKLHVVVNSMDQVKAVTRDLDQTMANRCPPLAALTMSYGGNDIIWSNSNTHWRNMRKILATQVMSDKNLKACESFRTYEVRRLVKEVYSKFGTKININEIAFKTEVNVVTSMLWGCSKLSGDGNDSSSIGDGFREVEFKIVELMIASNISDFLPILSRFDLQGRQREMQKQLVYVDRIFENIIQGRIEANSRKNEGEAEEDRRKDFVQVLLELKEEKDAAISLDTTKIKALLMDIVLAATDTTSTMVEWVMSEILNNPGVMRKAQDELTDVIGMNVVQESHLPKLTYLDAVIKETMRVHTPAPLLVQRCPDESCTVGGYTIPKGTIIYINVWAIHHDPKNWTDPLEFKPERFLIDKWDYHGNNFKFLPFGSGRRICPGIPLGEKMLMYILASLLHSFDWSLPEDEEFELSDEFGSVTKKRKPLIAIPSQRLSDATLYFC